MNLFRAIVLIVGIWGVMLGVSLHINKLKIDDEYNILLVLLLILVIIQGVLATKMVVL